MLLDSDILIDYLRGVDKSRLFLENSKINFHISFLSKFEILSGAINKNEIIKLEAFLANFVTLPLTNSIISNAYDLFKKYHLANQIGIFDSIIASTAQYFNLPLCSRNHKHYKMIDEIKLIIPY
ncbi:Putative PIN domain nucleic acid-binding protein [Ignavibacterium album JCM 16511]|uniref:Ribonuclease VapC n=1 Tax=Ignavibacterium album (strain DSM 19864 / JCM 16511 / NBRC 101810 / Mat9-16) TaxID=945713 RepID=I0AL63_IGNAJ|nr:type II toxin-antitoxin system VapC family toxin [Ignavibacterium album]AFH49720.1 Putative PIN domain nucleic acid-binding protein [Ignavibacterium album JCM 16511]